MSRQIGLVWLQDAHTHSGRLSLTPPNCTRREAHRSKSTRSSCVRLPQSGPAAPLFPLGNGLDTQTPNTEKTRAAHSVSFFPLNSLKQLPEQPKRVETKAPQLRLGFFPPQNLYFQFLKATLARHIETDTVSKHSFPAVAALPRKRKSGSGSGRASDPREPSTPHPPPGSPRPASAPPAAQGQNQ